MEHLHPNYGKEVVDYCQQQDDTRVCVEVGEGAVSCMTVVYKRLCCCSPEELMAHDDHCVHDAAVTLV